MVRVRANFIQVTWWEIFIALNLWVGSSRKKKGTYCLPPRVAVRKLWRVGPSFHVIYVPFLSYPGTYLGCLGYLMHEPLQSIT